MGQFVYSLMVNGYRAIGVDTATATIEAVRRMAPELDVRIGDICNLAFEESSFDGYWSLGVIEHNWGGYQQYVMEMDRVLKAGGYLFISFPAISLLRRIKIAFGRYDADKSIDAQPPGFYQFILDKNRVRRDIESVGFELIETQWLAGVKGVKEELPIFGVIIEYAQRRNSRLANRVIFLFDLLIRWATGNSVLLVFRKNKDS